MKLSGQSNNLRDIQQSILSDGWTIQQEGTTLLRTNVFLQSQGILQRHANLRTVSKSPRPQTVHVMEMTGRRHCRECIIPKIRQRGGTALCRMQNMSQQPRQHPNQARGSLQRKKWQAMPKSKRGRRGKQKRSSYDYAQAREACDLSPTAPTQKISAPIDQGTVHPIPSVLQSPPKKVTKDRWWS